MPKNKYDFSGYATKVGLKCTDGRIIIKDAFKHQDGQIVPLVWQHLHNEPKNILGHAVLENREDGVYTYGKFNDTEAGKNAKLLVDNGDITSLSIYANQLKQEVKKVIHGSIIEVSLVLSGANPGALIDNLSFAHGDGSYDEDESEAIIYTGLEFSKDKNEIIHDESKKTVSEIFDTLNNEQKEAVYSMLTHASSLDKKETKKLDKNINEIIEHSTDDMTIGEIFNSFTDDQKNVVYYLISQALGESESAEHSNINNKGEEDMKKNVFDNSIETENKTNTLTHDQLKSILKDSQRYGSLKESFLAHAETYGFDPIDVLFPDAKDIGELETIKRETSWVSDVLADTTHTPFSRIRTRYADLTPDEARAKGYVTGELKKEQVVTLFKRSTTPTTIYKKQKLDRDDMLDISDFDVVLWLKKEMRMMLDEEIARAVLISDGRGIAEEDKINEQNIRPIAMDDPDVYIQRVQVNNDAVIDDIIDDIIRARKYYKGTGVPAFYTSTDILTEMLLIKDKMGHRLYKTVQELASVLRVSKIVEVEPMNEAVRVSGDDEFAILGIIVNLKDYSLGADKGGQVALFDDFDIDYNQQKYLIETRLSGALTKPKAALVIERKPAE